MSLIDKLILSQILTYITYTWSRWCILEIYFLWSLFVPQLIAFVDFAKTNIIVLKQVKVKRCVKHFEVNSTKLQSAIFIYYSTGFSRPFNNQLENYTKPLYFKFFNHLFQRLKKWNAILKHNSFNSRVLGNIRCD